MSRRARIITVLLLALAGTAAPAKTKGKGKASRKHASHEAEPAGVPINEASAKDIIAGYTFVGDFSQHEAERKVSDEVFWRYPLSVPKVDFPIEMGIVDPKV